MNREEDPSKKDLPDSDYKSVKEDLISPEDSDNSSIERFLPEVAKKKKKSQDIDMSNNNQQEGSQANNNNLPHPSPEDFYRVQAMVLQLQAEKEARNISPPPPPHHHQQSRAEVRFQKFTEDVRKTHGNQNPDFVSLDQSGANFQIWEDEVNCTLDYVFSPTDPFLGDNANFAKLDTDGAKSVMNLFRVTVTQQLRTTVAGPSVKTPLDMFNLIKSNCKHWNHQHKLRIVDWLMSLLKNNTPSTDSTLPDWTNIVTELEQLKVSAFELYRLLLQSGFVAPTSVNKNNFGFTINAKLEAKDDPVFSEVVTTIQSACGQHKNKATDSSSSYAAMDLNAIQAVGQGKYVHLNNRNPSAQQQRQPPTQRRPNLSLEKASFYKGQPNPSEALKAKYGAKCLVCDSDQHWYNNCDEYWGYVRSALFEPPPRDSASPQSKYRPAPQQGRLRQLDVPEASDGQFLLDSGASTHVSGNLNYFVTRQILPRPKTIALAVADCTVDVRFKGTIKIPMSNGVIEVDDVYYCPGVDGVILSVGRLTENGWTLNISGEEAMLISPDHVIFSTTFRNHCWYIEMCKEVMNKVTSIPSFFGTADSGMYPTRSLSNT
ncbi:hypothetical protein Pst134EA_030493 [Puccinia striiformis f. sp. tritici]|uniref:hypothetical protein n=1 Tax=Puccinia striiformis f. sp. tritici TaxID=168172 RepID=UPI002007F7F2|nr:hypothetical protein Pst134EA_030493 [Puccinia striiformis f. sp. tritici]KAH9446583.1 hypothetical protein Pst134EA_030493 [Puccinia striiformis f. sp. tritici]